jgi:hypothetical protein
MRGVGGPARIAASFLGGGPDFLSVVFRSTWEGFADRDSVALTR